MNAKTMNKYFFHDESDTNTHKQQRQKENICFCSLGAMMHFTSFY